jgi:hypothetical protein
MSELYGPRFFDILLLDSLYAQAPVLRMLDRLGWDAVITFRQERRDLYQDALGLFQARPADLVFEHQQEGVRRRVQLWHAADLPFTEDYARPVRVVRSEEEVTRKKIQGGQPYEQTTQQQWCWTSTLEDKVFSANLIWQLGHLRWKTRIMVGMISPKTGRSSTASCMLVGIAPKTLPRMANVTRFPIEASRPSC